MKQLKRKKCPKNLYNIIESYLNDRFAILKTGNITISKKLDKGCPQGSALGPGLWNINYDNLLEIETPENSEIMGFCDDTKVLVFGKDIKQIEIKANQILEEMSEWAKSAKLEFNSNKSAAVLITKVKKFTPPKIILK